MRTKRYMVNSISAIVSYMLILFLALINRKIFVLTLDYEYLGYENLINDIFQVMSVAELGIDTIITYHLYRALASNNKNNVSKLMSMYRYVYLLIGSLVLVLSILAYPFVERFLLINVSNLTYARMVYIVQCIVVVSTYFLAYKRALFIADQKEYVCIQADAIFNLLVQLLQIAILYFTHSYILYICIKLIRSIGANLLVHYRYAKEYREIKRIPIRKKDFQEFHFWEDAGNFLIHKIAYIIYNGVDNIVITIFLGLKSVALFGNYTMIQTQATLLIEKFLKPLRATIGNLVNENLEYAYVWFRRFDIIGQVLGTFVLLAYAVLFQPFIVLWLGETFILPFGFVLALSLKNYLLWAFELLYYFRSAYGNYNYDRKYMILAAVCNLFGSILMGKMFGITGIAVATLVGMCIITWGRICFVYEYIFEDSVNRYLMKHIIYLLVSGIGLVSALLLCRALPISLGGFLVRIVIVFFCTILSNGMLFAKNSDVRQMLLFGVQLVKTMMKKKK